MTNEKALEILEHNWTCLLNYDYTEKELCEALDLAIKALEVTEQVNSSHNGVHMFPKGAFKSIYNERED